MWMWSASKFQSGSAGTQSQNEYETPLSSKATARDQDPQMSVKR